MTTETETFKEQLDRRTLQQLFGELRRLANEAGSAELGERIEQSERAFKSGKLRVLLLGQFNHGKSLALNALLRKIDLLPISATPTTSLITEISYGPETEVSLLDKFGRRKTMGLSQYREEAGQLDAERYRRAEITAPIPLLKDFTFVDTPGLSDPDSFDPEILGPELTSADVIVFLLSAVQPLTVTEQAFIKEKLGGKNSKRVIFLVNQTDRLSEAEELPGVMQRVNNLLAELMPGASALPFSAFEAAKGVQQQDNNLLERANFPGVSAALTSDLLKEKERLQEASLLGGMEALADELKEIFDERHTAGQAELKQIDEARAQLDNERGRMDRVRLRIQERTFAELDRMTAAFIADVNAYGRRLTNALPDQIATAQQATPHDVSRNLPFYLEYALKNYMEARAEQFKDELRRYLQTINEEIEQEFQQTVRNLDPEDVYLLTTLPRLRPKDTVVTWIARGVTGVGAITIFLFGNILFGVLWLVAGEVVRQAGAMRQQEQERLLEASRKALTQALDAAEGKLKNQLEEVKRALGTELADIFAKNFAALQTRLDEVERQSKQTREERAREAAATEQALTDLASFKTRLAHLADQLSGPEVSLEAD
jgi:hypothetical protein